MPSKKTIPVWEWMSKHITALKVALLWFTLIPLAVLTAIAYIASSTRADCGITLSSTSIRSIIEFFRSDGVACRPKEKLSALVNDQSSYFQSTHIIIVQFIATITLILFEPYLSAMIWSILERSESPTPTTMTMDALDNGIQFTNSPGFWSTFSYVLASGPIHHPWTPIFLVILISTLSQISPLALSPVYRPHIGPYPYTKHITNGGGVGTLVSRSLNLTDYVPQGQVAGRAIINTATALKTPIPLTSFNISAAPFIPRDTVQTIWEAQVPTVVAYSSIDCGPLAPSRFTSSRDFVSFGNASQSYFAPQGANFLIYPLFAGQSIGVLTNEPKISAVYLNTTISIDPGVVQAQSSVIFLGANGTLEGAQQRITSPEPTSRIQFVDVLVCTSNTALVISSCHIASILATSPVMTYYDFWNHIPMYDTITPEMKSNGIPPLSFMSYNTTDSYDISTSYVKDVLFGQTAQGLVQGLLTNSPVNITQDILISSTFGTSQPALLFIVLAVSIICAVIATLATWSARKAAPMDLMRILAISRNPELDDVFVPLGYSDRKAEMDEGEALLKDKVGYKWVDSLKRHALVFPLTRVGKNDTDGDEVEYGKRQ